MKTLRIIIFIIALILIFLDIGPFFTSGEINIGLLAGLFAGTVLLIYAVFFRHINLLITKTFSYTAGKAVLSIIAVLMCFVLFAGGYTLFSIVRYGHQSETETEYIIVLGCKVNGTEPGRFLNLRIKAAYNYLNNNPGSKAILSGGQGEGEDISEAECIFNALISLGVSPDRLIKEEKSKSTSENFKNSCALLESMNIKISDITVVTNDFHEFRAAKFAEKNGIRAYPYPAKTPWNGYLPFAVREVFAVWYQIYLGQNKLVKSGVLK